MFIPSAKTRSYLLLLIALVALTMVMPFIEVQQAVLDNIIVSIFFLALLLAAIKMISTKGVAPERPFFKTGIKLIIAVAFTADVAQNVLYATLRKKGDLFPDGAGLSQLSGQLFWFHLLSFITLIGYAFLVLVLIILIIKDLFSGARVTVNKIYGAIVVYLLLGVLWSFLFSSLELIKRGSVSRSDGVKISSFGETQYFSFATLSTTGYGDIIPESELAMVLANLEAMVGQLYLAILVARLVGLYTSQTSSQQIENEILALKQAAANAAQTTPSKDRPS